MRKRYVLIFIGLLLFNLTLGVYAYKISGIKPETNTVSWHANATSLPYAGITAADTWNAAASGRFKFSYSSYSYGQVDYKDNRSDVGLANLAELGFSQSAVGIFISKLNSGNTYSHFDILLNTRWNWGTGSGDGYYDYQGILTHEFGHAVGLDDVYDSYLSNVTMYGYATQWPNTFLIKRTLKVDDINGLYAIWGSSMMLE
jgi:hypothetical protein